MEILGYSIKALMNHYDKVLSTGDHKKICSKMCGNNYKFFELKWKEIVRRWAKSRNQIIIVLIVIHCQNPANIMKFFYETVITDKYFDNLAQIYP